MYLPANYEVLGSGNPQVGQILHCLLSITNHCLFSDAINKQLAYLELSQAVVGVLEELGGEADDLLLSHLLVLLDNDRQSLQLHLALVHAHFSHKNIFFWQLILVPQLLLVFITWRVRRLRVLHGGWE